MTPEPAPPTLRKRPYFLAQEFNTVSPDWPQRWNSPHFHFCRTVDDAKRYFDIVAGKVDGFDHCDYVVDGKDLDRARTIAEVARDYDIDLWNGVRWFKQFRIMPAVPGDLVGYQMNDAGRIGYRMFEDRNHLPDMLNPKAVDWMLDVLDEVYWPKMADAINGYFFPEGSLGGHGVWEGGLVKMWNQAVYSPYVLEQWRKYCAENDVRHEGSQVDRFPVPFRHMTEPHPDKTVHVGETRPMTVPSFTRFADIGEGPAVWLAWEDFLCKLFHENFVGRICRRLNRTFAGSPRWRGNCMFTQDWALQDYRNYTTRTARTCTQWRYFPQGRRVGMDTRRLFADPHITCFIAETIPSVSEYHHYEENFLAHGQAFARAHGAGDRYGFMIHYDDSWSGPMQHYQPSWRPIMDDIEEDLRWEMFYKHKPPVFSYYCVPRDLCPRGQWYQGEMAERFWKRVVEYKNWYAASAAGE